MHFFNVEDSNGLSEKVVGWTDVDPWILRNKMESIFHREATDVGTFNQLQAVEHEKGEPERMKEGQHGN